MALYTNVSPRLLHLGQEGMLVPNEPTEVSDEFAKTPHFQRLLKAEEVKAGEHHVKSNLPDAEEDEKPAPKQASQPAHAPRK